LLPSPCRTFHGEEFTITQAAGRRAGDEGPST